MVFIYCKRATAFAGYYLTLDNNANKPTIKGMPMSFACRIDAIAGKTQAGWEFQRINI